MTIRGGGNPIWHMACAPRFRMGPPPRSFAADAHDCIMVRLGRGLPDTSLWRDIRALGELPSDGLTPIAGLSCTGSKTQQKSLDTKSPIQVAAGGTTVSPAHTPVAEAE